MEIPELKSCLTGSVEFTYCRSNELWYTTENGFLFPVPVSDIGDATFFAKDKAMLFLRYIRKYREQLIKAKDENNSEPSV